MKILFTGQLKLLISSSYLVIKSFFSLTILIAFKLKHNDYYYQDVHVPKFYEI